MFAVVFSGGNANMVAGVGESAAQCTVPCCGVPVLCVCGALCVGLLLALLEPRL